MFPPSSLAVTAEILVVTRVYDGGWGPFNVWHLGLRGEPLS